MDKDLPYELYVDGDLIEDRTINGYLSEEFKLELEEGRHAVILIVDFGYGSKLGREIPVISPYETEDISFTILEFEIRH